MVLREHCTPKPAGWRGDCSVILWQAAWPGLIAGQAEYGGGTSFRVILVERVLNPGYILFDFLLVSAYGEAAN